MSVSKWAYSPEKCDGDFCPGDCDKCGKAEEVEVDYFSLAFPDLSRAILKLDELILKEEKT
jgi:hypothetical protein